MLHASDRGARSRLAIDPGQVGRTLLPARKDVGRDHSKAFYESLMLDVLGIRELKASISRLPNDFEGREERGSK